MKETILGGIGVIGGFLLTLIGGWSESLTTLVIFMIVDYISGLIVAGVFRRSSKSETGGLESKAGWKGLARKCMTLVFVLIACRLDILLNTTFVRDAVVIGFICNEAISIVENAGIMGLPVPKPIVNAIDVLNKKTNSEVKNENVKKE